MHIKLGLFVPDSKIVSIYAYELCDEEGNEISNPAYDFINKVKEMSLQDAQILISQINDTANKYGLLGRNESSLERPRLEAFPSKSDQDGFKISMRHRLYYWSFDRYTILLGGGCFKPKSIDGKQITDYQSVPECESSAAELSKIALKLEALHKEGRVFLEERETDIQPEDIIEI